MEWKLDEDRKHGAVNRDSLIKHCEWDGLIEESSVKHKRHNGICVGLGGTQSSRLCYLQCSN